MSLKLLPQIAQESVSTPALNNVGTTSHQVLQKAIGPAPGDVVLGNQTNPQITRAGSVQGPRVGDMVLGGKEGAQLRVNPSVLEQVEQATQKALSGAAGAADAAAAKAAPLITKLAPIVGPAAEGYAAFQAGKQAVQSTRQWAAATQDLLNAGGDKNEFLKQRANRLANDPDLITPQEAEAIRKAYPQRFPGLIPPWANPTDPRQTPDTPIYRTPIPCKLTSHTDVGPLYLLDVIAYTQPTRDPNNGQWITTLTKIDGSTLSAYVSLTPMSSAPSLTLSPMPGYENSPSVRPDGTVQPIDTSRQPVPLSLPQGGYVAPTLGQGQRPQIPQNQNQGVPQNQRQGLPRNQGLPQGQGNPNQPLQNLNPNPVPQDQENPGLNNPLGQNNPLNPSSPLLPLLGGVALMGAIPPKNTTPIDKGINPDGTPKKLQQQPQQQTQQPPSRCNDPCMARIQQQNDNLLDKVNAGLQGLDIAMLNGLGAKLDVVNTKLGPQVEGGLSGLIGRFRQAFDKFAEWAHLDRILNVLTFATTLHNAYMLSNALTQTLFSMLSNVLAVIGIKDKDGNPLNLQQILGGTFENILKAIIGADTVDGIKATWKKYSRIYQAAANILWSIQSIGYSILSALEVVGSWVAKIGNALQKWRVVGERAFSWMNPQPNFQNRFFTVLQDAQDVVSQVDQVASEVLNIESTVGNIGQQYQEIQKAVSESPGAKPGTPTPEAAVTAAAAAASKAHSQTPAIPLDSQVKPEG